MDKLLKMIEKEKSYLASKLNSTNDELDFLDKLLNCTSKDILEVLSKASRGDLLLALLLANNNSRYSFQELLTVVNKSEDIIQKLQGEKFKKLLYYIDQIIKQGAPREKIIELFNPTHKFTLADLSTPGFNIYLDIKLYFEKENVHPEDFRFLLTAILSTENAFWVEQMAWLDSFSVYFDARVKVQKLALPLSTFHAMAKDGFEKIVSAANTIIRHHDKLNAEDRSKKRTVQKSLIALTALEGKLPQLLKTGEIRNYEELIKKITEPEIRLEVLKLIYKHNMDTYTKIEAEYQKLSSSPVSKYQSLFHQYGLSVYEETVEDMMTTSLEDIESMLRLISTFGITNSTTILSIIKRSDASTMNFLSTQVSKGIISPELLQEHTDIFYAESSNFKCLSNNLAFLKSAGLNPHYLDGDKELFILPSEKLQKSFQTLGTYDLLPSLKTGQDYSFLGYDNLESGIDTLLELGYESMLEENPSLLNYQNRFDRLRLLKDLNIPVDSMDALLEVLTSDSFLVADSSLGEYLYNAATCRHDGKKQAEEREISPIDYFGNLPATKRTYNINEVIISKNRVQRNLNQNQDLNSSNVLYAITNGTTLSDEEYDKIVSHMTSNKDQKGKVKSQESA